MGIQPGSLAGAAQLVGIRLPEGDEDALWRCARAWRVTAERLRRTSPVAVRIGSDVEAALQGEAAGRFAEVWGSVGAPDGLLDQLADACDRIAAACTHAAAAIEEAKRKVLAELALLAATVATFAAAMPGVGLAGGLVLAQVIATSRLAIRAVLIRLALILAGPVAAVLDIGGVADEVRRLLGAPDGPGPRSPGGSYGLPPGGPLGPRPGLDGLLEKLDGALLLAGLPGGPDSPQGTVPPPSSGDSAGAGGLSPAHPVTVASPRATPPPVAPPPPGPGSGPGPTPATPATPKPGPPTPIPVPSSPTPSRPPPSSPSTPGRPPPPGPGPGAPGPGSLGTPGGVGAPPVGPRIPLPPPPPSPPTSPLPGALPPPPAAGPGSPPPPAPVGTPGPSVGPPAVPVPVPVSRRWAPARPSARAHGRDGDPDGDGLREDDGVREDDGARAGDGGPGDGGGGDAEYGMLAPERHARAVALARAYLFATDAGYGFFPAGDAHRKRARAVPPVAGQVTLDLRGDPEGFTLGTGRVAPAQFAVAVRELIDTGELTVRPGEVIRLHAGRTGDGPDSPAATLARELGIDVIAPEGPLWTEDGSALVESRWRRFAAPAGMSGDPAGAVG